MVSLKMTIRASEHAEQTENFERSDDPALGEVLNARPSSSGRFSDLLHIQIQPCRLCLSVHTNHFELRDSDAVPSAAAAGKTPGDLHSTHVSRCIRRH